MIPKSTTGDAPVVPRDPNPPASPVNKKGGGQTSPLESTTDQEAGTGVRESQSDDGLSWGGNQGATKRIKDFGEKSD